MNTTSTIPAPVQVSLDKKLLAQEQPNLIFSLFATKRTMPRNAGTTLRMSRMSKLNLALAELGNSGLDPVGQAVNLSHIDARIQFHGTFVEMNEQVTLTNQCPILNETAKVLGICLRETEDQLTKAVLAATSTVINMTSGTNGDTPTELNAEDLADVRTGLLAASALSISSTIEGQNKFGTAPVRNAFFVLSHTDIAKDLRRATGFEHSSKYPSQTGILPSEEGVIDNFRFLISPLGSITAKSSSLGNDLYNNIVTGMDSHTIIDQDGFSARTIYRPPIYSGPLAQNFTLGFVMSFAGAITHDTWVANIRSTLGA